ILKTLLAPVIYDLTESVKIDFVFINGSIECPPSVGIAEQYDGPYYRFLDSHGPNAKELARLARSMSRSAVSPEDFAREWRTQGMGMTMTSSAHPCDLLEQQLENHPDGPFDGVIAFSEGCSVAASLMLRRAAQGKAPLFAFAVFFCAIFAIHFDRSGAILADEYPARISVPTLHVVGARDPALLSSLALYNLCDHDLAVLYDHGKGHTIPWGPITKEITNGVCECIRRAQYDL
ncbi:MAG: hypothetical protein Q9224_001863, partial [Gallowayella concinna]